MVEKVGRPYTMKIIGEGTGIPQHTRMFGRAPQYSVYDYADARKRDSSRRGASEWFHEAAHKEALSQISSVDVVFTASQGPTVKWTEDNLASLMELAERLDQGRFRTLFASSGLEPDDSEIEEEKRERRHGLRMAGVWLDGGAVNLLMSLEEESSVTWESLPKRVGSNSCEEAVRATALLSCAGLCEAGRTRLRLSEYGVRLLASDWWQEVRAEHAG